MVTHARGDDRAVTARESRVRPHLDARASRAGGGLDQSRGRTQMFRKRTGLPWSCSFSGPFGACGV
jgi:hypothetical protein